MPLSTRRLSSFLKLAGGGVRKDLPRGRIAQLVRALASHARGRRFESYCDHHKNQPLACLMKLKNPITVSLTVRVNIDYVPVLSREAPSPTPSDVYWREQ